jgi:hypothetical protein
MVSSIASKNGIGAQLLICAVILLPIVALSQQPGQLSPEAKRDATAPQTNPPAASAQGNINLPPIEFESHGLQYQSVTKGGVTVMFAALPPQIKEYSVIQVTVTNGTPIPWTVKPEDFSFRRQDGTQLSPSSADEVVATLLEKAGRNDVIKLQLIYEQSIYALSNFRSTNGYEQRRQAAMAQFVNVKFKAAAEASAVTLVPTKLKPGDSTDGAVFFQNRGKMRSLGTGLLTVHTCGQAFDFQNTQSELLKK